MAHQKQTLAREADDIEHGPREIQEINAATVMAATVGVSAAGVKGNTTEVAAGNRQDVGNDRSAFHEARAFSSRASGGGGSNDLVDSTTLMEGCHTTESPLDNTGDIAKATLTKKNVQHLARSSLESQLPVVTARRTAAGVKAQELAAAKFAGMRSAAETRGVALRAVAAGEVSNTSGSSLDKGGFECWVESAGGLVRMIKKSEMKECLQVCICI